MDDVTLELGNAYVGSAYSPTIEVEQTSTGYEMTVTTADRDNPGHVIEQTLSVDSAGFGAVTATVDQTTGTAAVTVTASGPDTAKDIAFAFSGIKGDTGDATQPGAVGTTELADGAVTVGKLAAPVVDGLTDSLLVWEQGSIKASDGSDTSASNRIRTHGRLTLAPGTVVRAWCDEDYCFALSTYDSSDAYVAYYWNGTVADELFGAIGYVVGSGETLRFVLRTVDDGDLAPDAGDHLHVEVIPTDTDALTHGAWTVGAIKTDGTNTARDTYKTYCRTTGFTRMPVGTEAVTVEVARPGYVAKVCEYGSDGTYIGYTFCYYGSTRYAVDPTHLYRFQVARASGSDLLPPEEADGVVRVSVVGFEPFWSDEDERLLHQMRYTSKYSGSSATVYTNTTLLHFSDIHGDAPRLARIMRYVAAHPGLLDDVVCTGDMQTNHYGNDHGFWDNSGAASVLTVLGNHDMHISGQGWTSSSNYVSKADAYSKFTAPYYEGWGVTLGGEGCNYWYKDYPVGSDSPTLRLIGLDLSTAGVTGMAETTQLAWFESILADAASEGLAVIVAEHYPVGSRQALEGSGAWFDSDYGYNNPAYWLIGSDWHDAVASFVSGGGEFVCWMCGHTHADLVSVSSEYPTQVVLGIDTASITKAQPYSDTARVDGTPTQDLFDLVSVDLQNKQVRVARIGASENMRLMRKKALCIDYTTGDVISAS